MVLFGSFAVMRTGWPQKIITYDETTQLQNRGAVATGSFPLDSTKNFESGQLQAEMGVTTS